MTTDTTALIATVTALRNRAAGHPAQEAAVGLLTTMDAPLLAGDRPWITTGADGGPRFDPDLAAAHAHTCAPSDRAALLLAASLAGGPPVDLPACSGTSTRGDWTLPSPLSATPQAPRSSTGPYTRGLPTRPEPTASALLCPISVTGGVDSR